MVKIKFILKWQVANSQSVVSFNEFLVHNKQFRHQPLPHTTPLDRAKRKTNICTLWISADHMAIGRCYLSIPETDTGLNANMRGMIRCAVQGASKASSTMSFSATIVASVDEA